MNILRKSSGHLEISNDHRIAFPKLVKEVVRISDIILEILDARFVEETRNLEVEQNAKDLNKKIIYVLNKADLVDIDQLKKEKFLKEIHPYIFFSCKTKIGTRNLRDRIKIEAKRIRKENPHFQRIQVGIVGYPNTGKSSIINLLCGSGAASTSKEAGHTRGIQRVRFIKDIMILDTPGVFPDKENSIDNQKDLKKHAKIGIRTYDKVKEPIFVIVELFKDNKGLFERHYGIDARGDVEVLLEQLGKKMHLLKKGGEIDMERTARMILKDWQKGKIRN